MKMETKIKVLAQDYISCSDNAELMSLQKKLDKYEGDFNDVIRSLKPQPHEKVETGLLKNRPFMKECFASRYSDYLMSIYVPEDYNFQKAYGLLIFLHGGGTSTPANAGSYVFEHYGIADILKESGYIICCPCAPKNEMSFSSWNLPEVDEYLMDVIEEMQFFYNIDPDSVILCGTSMGGIGANHIAHRLGDRFASVLSSASCWDIAYWPCLMGTPFWILQGCNDASMFKRRHGSDIEFARLARMRLEQAGVPHFYREHSGGHGICDGRRIIHEWLLWSKQKKRDPFYPHVIAVTPRGLGAYIDYRRHKTPLVSFQNHIDFHALAPAPNSRWVTIEGTGKDTLMYDMITMPDCKDDIEEDWNNFSLKLKRKHIRAGLVEAYIREDKTIEVTPANVTGFTLWLHPEMVNFDNVRVLVKGVERFSGALKPKLGTLLESYKRRRDWGLLYPAKITLEADKSWETSDQIKVLTRT